MRHLLVLSTFAAIVWLSCVVRSSGLRLISIYLISHAFFLLFSYAAVLIFPLESAAYATWYHVSACLPLGLASLISFKFSLEHGRAGGSSVVLALAVCAAVVALVLERDVLVTFHLTSLSRVIHWHFATAAIFAVCGIATFLSLAIQTGQVETATKVALAAFWTIFGVYMFAYSVGRMNPYCSWFVRASWIPTVAAFLTFSWLAWTLSSGQRELSHQGLPEVVAAEYQTLEPVFERRGL